MLANMRRMPYLCRSFIAKDPYNECVICGKRLAIPLSLFVIFAKEPYD